MLVYVIGFVCVGQYLVFLVGKVFVGQVGVIGFGMGFCYQGLCQCGGVFLGCVCFSIGGGCYCWVSWGQVVGYGSYFCGCVGWGDIKYFFNQFQVVIGIILIVVLCVVFFFVIKMEVVIFVIDWIGLMMVFQYLNFQCWENMWLVVECMVDGGGYVYFYGVVFFQCSIGVFM